MLHLSRIHHIKHNLGIDILNIQVNITLEWMPEDVVDGSGNGLMPSGNKPSPEHTSTMISFALWHE